jgi:hypothetical protein
MLSLLMLATHDFGFTIYDKGQLLKIPLPLLRFGEQVMKGKGFEELIIEVEIYLLILNYQLILLL